MVEELTVERRNELRETALKIEHAARDLSRALEQLEALPFATRQSLRDAGFVTLGHQLCTEMEAEIEVLRKPLIEDGRDPRSGQLLDPLDARRRRAAARGWKPSRHPELDAEFFNRTRPWPTGDRLHIKRFNENGDHEMASIVLKVEYANNSGRIFELTRPPSRRDRRETERSMVTADELLADCWEVD